MSDAPVWQCSALCAWPAMHLRLAVLLAARCLFNACVHYYAVLCSYAGISGCMEVCMGGSLTSPCYMLPANPKMVEDCITGMVEDMFEVPVQACCGAAQQPRRVTIPQTRTWHAKEEDRRNSIINYKEHLHVRHARGRLVLPRAKQTG